MQDSAYYAHIAGWRGHGDPPSGPSGSGDPPGDPRINESNPFGGQIQLHFPFFYPWKMPAK